MGNGQFRRYDKLLALTFTVLTLLFFVLAFTNKSFFDWAYERHQNQLSWYLRPLFLVPFCYFAYKRSWAGIFGTVFFLLTSMFWFPKPEVVSDQAKQFLEMEMEYLSGDWGGAKILMSLLVPVSFTALGIAFWKRSLWFGLSVVVFMAVAKMIWSVAFGGEAGKSIFIPAIIGLVICVGLIYLGFRKLEKKNK
ncbi:hypothetical protein BHU72_13160 [Desulfuribacillus stibiiarsenatis]|uniref:Uncharacterized protein n=1 Tax=Desulfuribacillus stibiiarsenatis TaxID=1390249 RepID=A0A1E5L8S5_9FIRM|nr:hypothetical protein [Desulfuribacillus stibiiarsenatis]OEH86552.1 hypothetical protein BHU72_13160 [Desulfuribacillus stibiiarsenatis]